MSSFRDQLKRQAGSSNWKAARAATKQGYQDPDIDDGSYVCKVDSFDCKVSRSNKPMVIVKMAVLRGDYQGTQLSKTYMLNQSDYYDMNLQFLTADLKLCDPSLVDTIPEMSEDEFFDELEDICVGITDVKPTVRCTVQKMKSGDRQRLNIYFNDLLDEDTPFDGPDTGTDEPDDTDEPGTDADDLEITRDSYVTYKPPGLRKLRDCQVTKVNRRQETATVIEVDDTDKIYENVPFVDLEVFEYDEEED
jgi:hypothetical protein